MGLNRLQINSAVFFSLSFFIMLIASFVGSEMIPEQYVRVFDEQFYLENIRNFDDHFENQDFNKYYNSRLLMPAITSGLMNVLQLDFTIENIRLVFLILNFLAILLAFYYFIKISQLKKFSKQTVSVGIILIFVNFFLLKQANYYPLLMDVFGFASGFALYYYYLRRSKLFYAVLALSLFVFPTTVMILGLLMISRVISFDEKGLPLNKHKNLLSAVLLVPAVAFFIFIAFFYVTEEKFGEMTYQIFSKDLVGLTIGLSAVYLFFLLRKILFVLDGIRVHFRELFSFQYAVPLLIIILYSLLNSFLSTNFAGPAQFKGSTFFLNLTIQFLSFPFKFLVSHFIYLGLPVIFLLIFQRRFFGQLKQEDPFLKIVPLLFLFLALGTETRQFLQFLPFVFIPLLSALQKIRFTNIQLIVFFTFQLLWSRFWFQINTPKGFLSEVPMTGNFFNDSAQNYFQFHGPWMSVSNSVMYGLIFMVVFALCWLLLRSSIHRKAELSK